MKPDRSRYLQSLADELRAPASRIRDLIGDKHWPTDGAYKEQLLAEVVRRHCPSGTLVARGFVISDIDPSVVSREQDLLLVDISREAPLFSEAGIVVAFPRNVLASISVKSSLRKDALVDVVSTLSSLRTAAAHPSLDPADIWCGGYAYEAEVSAATTYEHIAEAVRASRVVYRNPSPQIVPVGPDCIVAGEDLLWTLDRTNGDGPAVIRGFSCEGLAFAFFLGQLVNHLSHLRDKSDSDFSSLLYTATPTQPPEHRFQL